MVWGRFAKHKPDALSDEGLELWAAEIVREGWLTEQYDDVKRLVALLRTVRDMARAEKAVRTDTGETP